MDNLNLRLYNKIKKHLDDKDFNFNNEEIKEKIERYSSDLPLDYNLIINIKKYLRIYNDFYKLYGNKDIKLRYYQILALYFTEYYFKHKNDEDFKEFDTNFLAYWMATGSGKTIIMHLNVLQYITKLKNFDKLQIILTTPGVNLIEQHKREFIPFIEFLNRRYNNKIELIIDTTASLLLSANKCRGYFDMIDNPKIQRLILVDEAHIGISSKDEGEFKKLRNELNKKQSFLFEYSATFYNLASSIREDYEKSIIFDYNYNRFFNDGYGKDYFIKRVEANIDDTPKDNLDECLKILQNKFEAYYSLKDYVADGENLSIFKNRFPDKPLIAFMGYTVNNAKDEGKNDEVSDISKVLYYFAELTEEQRENFNYVFNGNIKGKLTLTRNKNIDDEILLSYGDGDYWGIINVGNGENFLKQINHEKIIIKPPISILEDKYLFKNIDSPQCPINVLIGSRKFAEGWNCFRVSIIGLINLGSSKGNKIIQIFGRGVRLKGSNNDGKRSYLNHIEDYYSIMYKNEGEYLIRKLETLCVLSLNNTYLLTFIKELEKQNYYIYSFSIPVIQNVINLNDNKKISFSEYSNRLPIFKQKRKEVGFKKVYLTENKIIYKTIDIENELDRFRIKLDYRTDKDFAGYNIIGHIKDFVKKYYDYLDTLNIKQIIDNAEKENKVKIYEIKNGYKTEVSLLTILDYIEEIKYKNDIPEDIELMQNIIEKTIEDFFKKLKNRINYVINSNNYIFTDKIKQWDGTEGDFISNYSITINFESANEKENFIKNYVANQKEEEYLKEKCAINKDFIYDYHIYFPLLLDNSMHDIIISPDALNVGEKKFFNDLTRYIKDNYFNNSRYEFYLMRNVQSLKNIGIFLENEEESYYPDFILWINDNEKNKIYINLIDPKGQTDIEDKETRELSDKVKIARKDENPILLKIQENINNLGYDVELNSFIILRQSSDLCKHKKDINLLKEKLLKYNILRIDWHEQDENGSYINNLIDGKSYLDIMFEKIGI